MMNSLISFEGFSDVVNNLIDKLSNAVGWVATHETPTKIAIDTYIKDVQNSNCDPLTKAALIANAKKSVKEYCNQYNIVSKAIEMIGPTAQPYNIDSDWLAQFMDKARLVSDSDFQVIWGNILAGECNAPGSVPKGLLHVVEQMDKDLANSFMKISALAVNFVDNDKKIFLPIMIKNKEDDFTYLYSNLFLEDLIDLEAIGLITYSDEGFSYKIEKKECIVIKYFDQEYKLPYNCEKFDLGMVLFTKIGQALYNVVYPEKVDGFFDEVCSRLWRTID